MNSTNQPSSDTNQDQSSITLYLFPDHAMIGPICPPDLINLKGKKKVYGPSLSQGDNLVYIGRQMYMGGWKIPKSKWFNPYTVKNHGRDNVLKYYRQYLLENRDLILSLAELNGKTLACWCHPQPCHGDILIELFKDYFV